MTGRNEGSETTVTDTRIVAVNGRLCPETDAAISPFDHGLLTGDGVFETLTTVGGQPFAWTRHYRRLVRSASALGLEVPPSEVLRRTVVGVVEANGLSEARVRITVTGGPAPLGSDRGEADPTVLVLAAEPTPWPPTVDVVIVPWPRNQRGATAGLKTTSYAENVRALAYARSRGAGEGIFADLDGNLCEGTGSNVWLVRDGRLETPSLATGCLEGVTRQLILEVVAPEVGLEVHEVVVPAAVLAEAEEAFITSATRVAQAVRRVDDRALPSAPGPVTEKVAAGLRALTRRDLDP